MRGVSGAGRGLGDAPVCVVCARLRGCGVRAALLDISPLAPAAFPTDRRKRPRHRGRWHEQIICVPLHTTLYSR